MDKPEIIAYMKDKNKSVKSIEKENVLDEINTTLLESLRRLRKLDTNNKEETALEIGRSNAISLTSRTILQTVGVQMLAKKQQYKLPELENKQ